MAALLLATVCFSSGGAEASKASPPRSSQSTVAAWENRCAEQPAAWSQELLCGIRSHDKAIAVSCAVLVIAVLGWVCLGAVKRSRAGGRE